MRSPASSTSNASGELTLGPVASRRWNSDSLSTQNGVSSRSAPSRSPYAARASNARSPITTPVAWYTCSCQSASLAVADPPHRDGTLAHCHAKKAQYVGSILSIVVQNFRHSLL